ncbi:MAG: response regulator [Candidatus Cloacimonetes bacterium]|nr:response regulator [Candidatus Cloacimonadota bacterium]
MSEKILIIEDDKFLSEFYRELLEQEGYEVTVADDGEVGLEKMQAGGLDLTLLDIMLPKKDGLTILRELSHEEKAKCGQIVMLTNLGQDQIIKDGFSLGASGYLIKSALTPDQVLHELRVFLQKSSPRNDY